MDAVMAENETRMLVLLMTDIVGSLRTKSLAGTDAYARTLKTHDALFRQAIAGESGELLHDTGDGFLAGFDTASRAVRCALRFQHALRTTDWEGPAPAVRIGLHAGEVTLIPGEGRPKIVGLAADLASRVNHLAIGGQILMTRAVYDEAKQFVREHPGEDAQQPSLSWQAHHAYRFKGLDQTVEIFEVGAKDLAPLVAPPDAEKAERHAPARRGRPLTAAIGLIIGGALAWWIFGDAKDTTPESAAPALTIPEPAPGPTLSGHTDTIWATAFSPDGMQLVTGSRDQTLRLWHSNDGRLLRTFTGHTDSIHAVGFAPDGKMVASASNDKTVRLWSLDSETEPRILTGHTDEVDAVAFAPHGRALATGSKDSTVPVGSDGPARNHGSSRTHRRRVDRRLQP